VLSVVKPLSSDAIGDAVLKAREEMPPMCWKLLSRRFGLGRARLNQLWIEARARREKDVYRHLSAGQRRFG